MAVLGRWTGGTKSQGNLPETWTAPTSLFDTEDRNDSSTYGWSGTTSTLTLPSSGLADGYLIVAAYEYQDTSNGRFNPQGMFVQASGTGTFVSSQTGGYNRDNSEDRSYVRCWAFVDNPSASSTYQFQWKADTDDATGGTERSVLEVIPFYYSDIGIYASTDSSLYGGTTPNQVTGWSGTDGTNITLVSNEVTVSGDNKRYLTLGSQFFEGRGGRTQRWHGFRIDGTKDDSSKACSYYRTTSNDENGNAFSTLIETSTADRTIDQFCYLGDGISNGQGGADIDGSTPAVGSHAMVVIELNDSAEVVSSRSDTTTGDLTNTGGTDMPVNEQTDVIDTSSFTSLTDTSVNVVQTADYLFGADISIASNNVANTGRHTLFSEYTVNSTADTDTFHGNYLRNNQGSQDTFGVSTNHLSALALTATDDVGVKTFTLSGSEAQGDPIAPAGWVGFWGINLDTLEASGAVYEDMDAALVSEATVTSGIERVREIDSALSGDSTINTNASKISDIDSILAANSTLSSSINRVREVDTSLLGNATFVSDIQRIRDLDSSVIAEATLAAIISKYSDLGAVLDGVATMSADIERVRLLGITLNGSSALNGATVVIRGISATTAGSSTLTSSASRIRDFSSLMDGEAVITANLTEVGTSFEDLSAALSSATTLAATLNKPVSLVIEMNASSSLTANLEVLLLIFSLINDSIENSNTTQNTLESTIQTIIWDTSSEFDIESIVSAIVLNTPLETPILNEDN